jgi:hypothetical protein
MKTFAKIGIALATAVAAVAVVAGILVAQEDDPPPLPVAALGIPTPTPYVSTPPRVEHTPTMAGNTCSPPATQLTIYWPDGVSVDPDLVMCTNENRTMALVKNVSENTVYYLLKSGKPYYYWDPQSDASSATQVKIFREAIRKTFAAKNLAPAVTIEPGVSALFHENPYQLRFGIDKEEQAAWQAAVLEAMAHERAKKQATQALENLIEDKPTFHATVVCTMNAYEIGKSIDGNVDDPSSLLLNFYEAGQGVSDCDKALAKAEEASRQEGRLPPLNRQVLRQVSEEPAWKTATNAVIEEAISHASWLAKVK